MVLFLCLMFVVIVILVHAIAGGSNTNDGSSKKHLYPSIDSMTGVQFEQLIASLLPRYGYSSVQTTPVTNDFGVDLLAVDCHGCRCAFQCKRYSKKLGIKPIQEVYAGAPHYGCTKTIVVTSTYFTENAYALARELGVDLWDRSTVLRMIS